MADHRYVKCAGISTSDEKNASTSMACAALETDLASAHTSVGRAGAARVSTRVSTRVRAVCGGDAVPYLMHAADAGTVPSL